jgi:hypothetical protein
MPSAAGVAGGAARSSFWYRTQVSVMRFTGDACAVAADKSMLNEAVDATRKLPIDFMLLLARE